MRRLHFIRHGRTEANDGWLYCGSTDLSLSARGAKALQAQKFSSLYPELTEGCAVYTSGMRRTEETLQILYGDVPHGVMPELREMDFGIFEMRSYNELKDDPEYQTWLTGDNEQNVCPGGESGAQLRARAIPAVERLLTAETDVLVVTHGGVIAAAMEHLFPERGKSRYDWQPKNGFGYTIEIEDGKAVSYTPIPDEYWRGKGYAFTQNRNCEYFPCHEGVDPETFNCLFCYCPLYLTGPDCGGACKILKNGVKDCSACLRPHDPEKFGEIIGCFQAYCAKEKDK